MACALFISLTQILWCKQFDKLKLAVQLPWAIAHHFNPWHSHTSIIDQCSDFIIRHSFALQVQSEFATPIASFILYGLLALAAGANGKGPCAVTDNVAVFVGKVCPCFLVDIAGLGQTCPILEPDDCLGCGFV